MPFEPIKINKARCPVCRDILVSEDPKKQIECSCGQLTIGGGHYMLYRTGKFKELSKLHETLAPHDVNEEAPDIQEEPKKKN